MRFIRDALRGLTRSSGLVPADPSWAMRWVPARLPSGVTLTVEDSLELGAVWACIDVITRGVAASPWMVYERETDDGDKRKARYDDAIYYYLNERPNADTTAIALREANSICSLTWGNAYNEIRFDRAGRPAGLEFIYPDLVYPRRRQTPPFELYYEVFDREGGRVELEAWQVLHVRGPGIGSLMGDNHIARMSRTIGLLKAQDVFASTYFGNNTIVGGVIEYPKTMAPDAHEQVREDWATRYAGPHKAHKPAILENGAKWVPMEIDAEGAQLVETRRFSVEEICRWFGVPPHKVQHLERATFNNIEHLGIEFAQALKPWALRNQQEANYKLFPARPARRGARFSEIDLGWLTLGDAKSRAEYFQIMRRIGVYTINEIRRKEGENTIGAEGDVRIVESNMVTLEGLELQSKAAGKKPAPAAPAKPAPGEDDGEGDDAAPAKPAAPDGSRGLVLGCLAALFAGALEAHGRRLRNRRADLERRHTPGLVDSLVAAERERARPALLERAAHALELADRVHVRRPTEAELFLAGDEAEAGDAHDAACRLVASLTAESNT